MSNRNHESSDENDDDIRSDSTDWTLETINSNGTIGDGGNGQGSENNSINALLEVKVQLKKLKEVEVEEKAKPIIQAIQGKIDESAKGMANQNAQHHKRKHQFTTGWYKYKLQN